MEKAEEVEEEAEEKKKKKQPQSGASHSPPHQSTGNLSAITKLKGLGAEQ